MAFEAIQTALRVVYPPRCTLCGGLVESEFGLCGPCWRDTPVLAGLVCDLCGCPLPGEEAGSDARCDDCLRVARPWQKGRAALIYKDNARKLVLALKHGDRHDVVPLAATWMKGAAAPLMVPECLFVPVPLHWTRLLKRRFNQSALLAQAAAKELNAAWCPDVLKRVRRTPSLDGKGMEARFATLDAAIRVRKGRRVMIHGRVVILVDDVMTSGATLAACAGALLAGGAAEVRTLTLARVVKDA
ncbi:DNA utilization protein GntX [Roseovarius sp. THAF27]|nr:DNA utilization protein GntX [Roseovarius sp. THAF27]